MSYEDQSYRFVITGKDPEDHNRIIILWRETDLVNGKMVRLWGFRIWPPGLTWSFRRLVRIR